jgi:hypothetical protein
MAKKQPSERVQPQLGDVIEIETSDGLAYAQYTHEHRGRPRYGSLVRVLPGIYPERPRVFNDLVVQEERFSVFFPLATALRQRVVSIVGHERIPESKQPFPTFRRRQGDVWWIWDGTNHHRARRGEQWTPRAIESVWNDTLLIERIASGWGPADDPDLS